MTKSTNHVAGVPGFQVRVSKSFREHRHEIFSICMNGLKTNKTCDHENINFSQFISTNKKNVYLFGPLFINYQ